ncbi:RmeS [Rhodospirillaceae bacterium LM-1]|nr:RmeS [Rhodospirillaceae bacterium LM-1]
MIKLESKKSAFTRSLFDSELPEDWHLVPVGEALLGTQYGLSEPGDTVGNTPIVGMRDINNGAVNLTDLATVDDGGADWNEMRLRRGDILLNRTNSADLVEKVGIVSVDSDAVFASYLVRLDVDREKADPEFVNFWLNTVIAQTALKRLSTRGVSQANINPTEFRKHCPLPLPPLPEQRKIAEILRTWDEAIEKLEALRAAKEKLYSTLADGLIFGTLQRGSRHREWKLCRLNEVTRELTQRNRDGSIGRDMVMGVTNSRGIVPMREQTIGGDLTKYKILPPRAFAYNPMRINVGSIAMLRLASEVLVSPDYVLFECLPGKLDPDYLDHLRQSHFWDHYINAGGSGSVRMRTYYDDLAALRVKLPNYNEQREISFILNTAQDEIGLLLAEIKTLTRQKRGLMQKLLTGEWRVKS